MSLTWTVDRVNPKIWNLVKDRSPRYPWPFCALPYNRHIHSYMIWQAGHGSISAYSRPHAYVTQKLMNGVFSGKKRFPIIVVILNGRWRDLGLRIPRRITHDYSPFFGLWNHKRELDLGCSTVTLQPEIWSQGQEQKGKNVIMFRINKTFSLRQLFNLGKDAKS